LLSVLFTAACSSSHCLFYSSISLLSLSSPKPGPAAALAGAPQGPITGSMAGDPSPLSFSFSPLLFSQPRTEERSGDDKGWFGPCRRLAGDGGAAAPWARHGRKSPSSVFVLPPSRYRSQRTASTERRPTLAARGRRQRRHGASRRSARSPVGECAAVERPCGGA